MEEDILEALEGYFNEKIKIDVHYKDLRKYEIYLQIGTMEHQFIYNYDAYLTFNENIVMIRKEIERNILKYYKRGG